MATAFRSSNRRTTPQPAPTVARITRSLSREPASDPVPQSRARTNRRSTRSESVESQHEQSRAKGKNALSLRAGLNAVLEDLTAYRNPESELDNADGLDATTAAQMMESVSGSSRMTPDPSFTPAVSQAVEEAENLDADFITASLLDLSNEATKVLDKIVPFDISVVQQLKTIQDFRNSNIGPTKALHRSLQQLRNLLNDPFNSDNNSYIHLKAILRSLFEDDFAGMPSDSRPDDIIFKANLTVFAADTLLLDRNSSRTLERFQSLDLEFPNLFMSSFSNPKSSSSTAQPGSSILVDDTFALALDIRTETAIMLLENEQYKESFNPDRILSQIFLTEVSLSDDTGSDEEGSTQQTHVRGWQIDGLRDTDDSLPHSLTRRITTRLEELRQYCSTDSEYGVNFDDLKKRFSWNDFLARTAEWVRRRRQELDNHIVQYGGEDGIVEQISGQRGAMTERGVILNSNTQSKVEPRVMGAATQPLPNRRTVSVNFVPASTSILDDGGRPTGPKKFERLAKAFSKQVNKRKSFDAVQAQQADLAEEVPQPAETPAPEILEDPQLLQLEHENGEEEQTVTQHPQSRTARESAIRFHQSQATQDQENIVQSQITNLRAGQGQKRPAFLDHQTNATRVEFDESSQAAPQAVIASSNTGKRPRTTNEEEDEDSPDPTQDEGFQTDRRIPDISSKRRTLPPSHRRPPRSSPPQKRQRSIRPSAHQTEDDGEHHSVPYNNDVDGQTGGDGQELQVPDNDQQAAASSAYRATAQLARQMVAAEQRPIQRRRPWTLEEENRLIELIAEFGNNYSLIESQDNNTTRILTRRSQVDLKDKCRVMRFNYHKYVR
ncbi:MAG: hypothetical protein M1822_009703 [Bathelium mastoideum]|nr:MAG: hypothetical protein M1822_009703 [Bathelium mastoideum]